MKLVILLQCCIGSERIRIHRLNLLHGLNLVNWTTTTLNFFDLVICLTLSWRRPLSYRNQSIDLRSKSKDWFLYDKGLRHERVKLKNETARFPFIWIWTNEIIGKWNCSLWWLYEMLMQVVFTLSFIFLWVKGTMAYFAYSGSGS